jgi:hypothetical protein
VIGQLPPDFFHQFFAILRYDSADAVRLEDRLKEMCQRQWLQAQLDVLPDMERETFMKIIKQDGVAVSTLNEFLEQRLEEPKRLELWHEAQMKIWSKVLKTVGDAATAEQRQEIKALIARYK